MGPRCQPPWTINLSFVGFIFHPLILAISFYFDPLPPWKHWVSCWYMGPACHPLCTINLQDLRAKELVLVGPICQPLCTIKVSFLGLFLAPDIWSLSFFFWSQAASKTLSKVLAHGTHMSSSMYNKVSVLGFFLPLIFGHLPWRCWLMGPTCQHLWTINHSFVGFIFYP